ncbi:rwd domain-containing protein [Coemansia asiatica]|uniref:Rwd domain-containing protein n=1 Tax=Coemansia asiatica TaxID=1052880 RepID=A0A9W7XLM6_9FUNG|nr:rwd domain-containing protein [Coemansia asiatica]KAJ2876647.1 rwd domain-containing protein [Coemansia asiatica]
MSSEHYAEEQQNEIEILQSIYPTEFVEESQDPRRFSLAIAVNDYSDDLRPCTLQLTIEYTKMYPDELPSFEIVLADEGNDAPLGDTDAQLEPQDLEYLEQKTREIAEDSLGMAMVFTMATNLKEVAVERLSQKTTELRRLKEERIQREIEAEAAKFVGTPVTRDSFLEWKARFEAEMTNAARLAAEAEEKTAGAKKIAVRKEDKLTGRQLFEQDRSLAMSDSRFMAEGEVSVDSSRFPKDDELSDASS